ncbi:NAD-dependent epimerase/dehydratase family protein [Agrococcus beijingensis]|uniref:NAD-dependent epimerase/dehydratase family protein n=1 Tax=Agrococcus beijingensis TaxID=3068634 RepID=UPI002740BCBA|nr:NAD-dependent epimerase/dehydratase family protein [Agrococcus sp. REN33]
MTLRLAITGVDGFVGRHVAQIAAERGHHVVGVTRSADATVAGVAELVEADLTEQWPRTPPVDAIVHLAGLAAVGPSFDEPVRYIVENAAMTAHLCEALLRHDEPARVVAASTGAIYAPSDEPIDETATLAYASPYAVSKGTVEHLLSYYRGRGLDTVVARPFNHIGAGQSPGFLVPDLLEHLDGLGDEEPLPAGNLDAERDYTDVRDVATAYLLLAEAPVLAHDVYNVASGRARSGHEVLAAICAALGRSVPELGTGELRPLDMPRVVGDATRLRDELDWAPAHDFADSIAAAVSAHAGVRPSA